MDWSLLALHVQSTTGMAISGNSKYFIYSHNRCFENKKFWAQIMFGVIYWRKISINPPFQNLKQFKIIAQGFTILKREFIFSKGSKIFRFFCSTNENVKMRCSIFEQSWNGKPWQRKLQNLLVLMIRIYRQFFSRAELSDELSFWPIWRTELLQPN